MTMQNDSDKYLDEILDKLHDSKKSKELTSRRYKANMELCELLRCMLMAYPDLRFSQALANFGFITVDEAFTGSNCNIWLNEYNLEPLELLNRVKNVINGIHNE